MGESTCPGCGMARELWRGHEGAGYQLGDARHCCEECARGESCACIGELTKEVILEDEVKGPAEEPEQMEHKG